MALAKSVKADLCEIYTDVEGIFTSDPRIVRSAKKIKNITYEEILEMSSSGSKVLHPRSVELAMKYGIKIHAKYIFRKIRNNGCQRRKIREGNRNRYFRF